MKQNRSALGRGLASLISSKPVPVVPPNNVLPQTAVPPSAVSSVVEKQTQVGFGASSQFPSKSIPSNQSEGGHFDGSAAFAVEPTVMQQSSSMPAGNTGEGVRYVSLSEVHANPTQPRKEFVETDLRELADSIKTLGVLQPILVRARAEGGGFEIVAGERRFRAAQRAGLTQIPVIIRHLSEREVVEIALVENVQRADLSPLEEAYGYNRLSEEFGLPQREIAERVGKDRATIANFLRLLSLPPAVLDMMKKGDISMGHAKAILTVREPAVQINLARKVVNEALSVRAIEAIVSRSVTLPNATSKPKERLVNAITPEVASVIDRLRRRLGTKVSVHHHMSGKGKIEVEYFSVGELERLMEIIGG